MPHFACDADHLNAATGKDGEKLMFFFEPGWTSAFEVVLYGLAINLASFGAFGWDKFCARRGLSRVPERTLLGLALVGGSPGAIAGQHIFRHKTYKEPFRTYLRLIVAIQMVALVVLAVALLLQ